MASSKKDIRIQTGDFLNNTQPQTSFQLKGQTQYYTNALDLTPANPNQVGPGWDLVSETDQKSLTGAYPAILPMQIITLGKNDKRIEFTMLINPETMNVGKTNSYQSSYTRTGWNLQLWGPNQDTISSTGRTAAFMNPATGLDNFLQNTTFGYLNFMAMIGAYRNNGYKLLDRAGVSSITRVIDVVTGVQILYDGNFLMGHFNNFTLDEDAEHPFLFNYNFEFIVSALDGSEYEIRGHYKQIPLVQTYTNENGADPLTRPPPQASLNNSVSVQAPVTLVADTHNRTNQAYNVAPPRPMDDQATIRLWTQVTHLPWSYAITHGFTDNSVQGNLRLRQELYTKTWNSTTNTFN